MSTPMTIAVWVLTRASLGLTAHRATDHVLDWVEVDELLSEQRAQDEEQRRLPQHDRADHVSTRSLRSCAYR